MYYAGKYDFRGIQLYGFRNYLTNRKNMLVLINLIQVMLKLSAVPQFNNGPHTLPY